MDKASTLDLAENKILEAQRIQRSYKMETLILVDPTQKKLYDNKLTTLSEELACCANDLKAMKGAMQRGELFVGSIGTNHANDDHGYMTGEEAGGIMLNDMNHIQDKTKSSLQNTKSMVAASKQIAQTTMNQLVDDRERIHRIHDETMRVEDNLQRSDKLIKQFGKRMATDRFIQCLACINMILLVGVVVYFVFRKSSGESALNQNTPENPVRMLRGFL